MTIAQRIDCVLDEEVAGSFDEIGTHKATAGAQAVVFEDGDTVYARAAGFAQFDPTRPLTETTPMDIASLTKPFTAVLAMQAVDEGVLSWETPVTTHFPQWRKDRRSPTLLQVLNHSSGLPAWIKFYERYPIEPDAKRAEQTRQAILREIERVDPIGEPGEVAAYSDLGYIALGAWLERAFDAPLDELVRARITGPLGLDATRYVRSTEQTAWISSAAATEHDPKRGRVVVGAVHDENCYVMGGVAGHAGLFSHAADVAAFGQHMLDIDRGARGIVSRETLHFAWSQKARGADGHHVAGWDTPSGALSSAGRGFARASTVGHLGFTGTSLWIERARGVVAVLLTNRVYPTRENERIKQMRVRFHEAILPPPP